MLEHGIEGPGRYASGARRCSRANFLESERPQDQPLLVEGEGATEAARRLVASIDDSYLAIQGPPGSGKSTVGAEMIVDLVAQGCRVGVTANSHKVIGELLAKVARVADDRGVEASIGQRSNDAPEFGDATHLRANDEALDALADGSLNVAGGTCVALGARGHG